MSINTRIMEALARFSLPVVPDIYQGKDLRYFTFNFSTFPANFTDNAPGHERALVQLHYCCPLGENSLSVRKQVKRALFAAGFTYPSEVNASDGSDRSRNAIHLGQHYVFEFEDIEGTGADG